MIKYKDRVFSVSVRALVEFLRNSGDIARGALRREQAMVEGARVHKLVQSRQGAGYTPEVTLKYERVVDIDGSGEIYTIRVEGRADGVMEMSDGRVLIDEIKGTYANVDMMEHPVPVHLSQAKCYAFLKTMEDKRDSVVRMTYVDLESEHIRLFESDQRYEELAVWFDELMRDYEKWCTFYYLHRKVRNESANLLEFPLPYREGQRDLVVAAYKSMRAERHLFIQASTGIGKTLSVVFPAVRVMGEERIEKIFYLTAKTVTREAAREAVKILRGAGLKAGSLELTAKERLCPMEEMDCDPAKCPYANGHMERVNDAVYELVTENEAIGRNEIAECAKKHMVCPFELSLDASYWVDVVICDYNYAFDPNVRLARYFAEGAKTDAVFLVDEAHNLIDRAADMISAKLTTEDIPPCRKKVKDIDKRLATAMSSLSSALRKLPWEEGDFFTLKKGEIEKVIHAAQKLNDEFLAFSVRYPHFYDREVLALNFLVRDFADTALDLSHYRIYCSHEGGAHTLKLFCVDPSAYLANCYDMAKANVFFSATLLPIGYYKRLLGGHPEDYAVYARSPFDTSNRLIVAATDFTTRYSRRNDLSYTLAASYIEKIVSARAGNYLVFCPSYAYMEKLASFLAALPGRVVIQGRNMSEEDREDFLAQFTQEEGTVTGLCVMGGIFSEGIDLKGERLIGAIILGTGMPRIGAERDLLKEYFEKCDMDGFDYAYKYPGFCRVLQAAGRVIRTDTDEGVIALLDDRFTGYEYRQLFPREWEDVVNVNIDNVHKTVTAFWEKMLDKHEEML